MNLLLINYEMDQDSAVLAWQENISRLLADQSTKVVVLTDKIGRYEQKPNLIVVKIPTRPWGVPRGLGGYWLFNFQVAHLIKKHDIDACFIHMNQRWAFYLFPVFHLYRIPVLLWYAHGTVSLNLRLAHFFSTAVVTSTKEGFRIHSSKVSIIGQGIQTDLFRIPSFRPERNDILVVGRVSERKNIAPLVRAMALVQKKNPRIKVKIVGSTLTDSDKRYEREIKELIAENDLAGQFEFLGFVRQEAVPDLYKSAFLHLNLSKTGSMDKVVLEALSCGCPVLTSNEAFFDMLKDFPDFIVQSEEQDALAKKILALKETSYAPETLRKLVDGRHDAVSFSGRICSKLKELAANR